MIESVLSQYVFGVVVGFIMWHSTYTGKITRETSGDIVGLDALSLGDVFINLSKEFNNGKIDIDDFDPKGDLSIFSSSNPKSFEKLTVGKLCDYCLKKIQTVDQN